VDAATTQVQVLRGRQVPLGGIRAMYVRRTLPHRNRSFVGAWCFVDHYGPDEIDPQTDPETGGGMDLPPHPHTGLQTVSWLFDGELEHRDSGGAAGLIRPGEVNLMTSGAGIAHSEVTTSGTTRLHGVQLWVALPDSARATRRDFQHHAPAPRSSCGASGRRGCSSGSSPASIGRRFGRSRPCWARKLTLHPGAAVALAVDPAYEHGVLARHGRGECRGRPDRAG
jgi:redox-sensitive bicupin YhaK (pirin superfamily)